jgi:predicted 3-demethylubiquinone-9 3-methyltransferase (glyoxalase superfamily)
MQAITPFLWFDDQAEQAAEFYVSVFKGWSGAADGGVGSEIVDVARHGEGGPGTPGSAMTVRFRLEGQEFTALNGGPSRNFTEAISFLVHCRTQREVDELWNALTEGGEESQCGWLKDRYGLSWQIIPTTLMELLHDPDPERAGRVMQAMLQMRKIDVEVLRRAAEAA